MINKHRASPAAFIATLPNFMVKAQIDFYSRGCPLGIHDPESGLLNRASRFRQKHATIIPVPIIFIKPQSKIQGLGPQIMVGRINLAC
jgi:hypothetical protein